MLDTFQFSTVEYHGSDTKTMEVFLETYLPDVFKVILQEGSYAEIVSSDGTVYGVRVSPSGDYYRHIITFEAI